jgi:NTE family protein
VATDITSGEPQVLEDGELIPALLASSAIPGVLPPVQISGRWYMDGLASANLPASLAFRRGAGSIVAFDTSPPISGAPADKAPVVALPQLVPMLNAVLSKQQRVSSLASAAAHVPVIYLPTPAALTGSLSFTASLEVARESYQVVSEFLVDLYRRFGVGAVGELPAGLYARPDALAPAPAAVRDVLVAVPPTDDAEPEGLAVTQSNHSDGDAHHVQIGIGEGAAGS